MKRKYPGSEFSIDFFEELMCSYCLNQWADCDFFILLGSKLKRILITIVKTNFFMLLHPTSSQGLTQQISTLQLMIKLEKRMSSMVLLLKMRICVRMMGSHLPWVNAKMINYYCWETLQMNQSNRRKAQRNNVLQDPLLKKLKKN